MTNAKPAASYDEVLRTLDTDHRQLLRDVLDGKYDHVDAMLLFNYLPKDERGPVAMSLVEWGAPLDFARQFIEHCWEVDSRLFTDAPGANSKIRDMFKTAQFPFPEGFENDTKAWRGGRARTPEQLAQGCCWTLKKCVACWFATQQASQSDGPPLVITAMIPPAAILHKIKDTDKHESEIIVDPDELCDFQVDPDTPEKWDECGRAFAARRDEIIYAPHRSA